MNIIKKLLSDVNQNKNYKIPVLLFSLSSLLYLLGGVSSAFAGLAMLLQLVFGIWLVIVAFKKKLLMWPILVMGLIIFIIAIINVDSSSDKFAKAKKYYDQKQYFSAKEYLNEIENEYRDKKEYIDIKKANDEKISQANTDLLLKAKNELSQNKINDSKETLNNILKYDNENPEANALLKKVQDLEQKQAETLILKSNKEKISALNVSINNSIVSKDFSKAKELLEIFLKDNPEIKKENQFIINLQNKINNSENQKIANDKYNQALDFFKNKEYESCISNLNDILNINKNHKDSKNLLLKAEKLKKIEDDKFWTNIKIGLIITVILIIIFIFSGIGTSCPSCNKWWARKLIDKKITNKESFYKTVIRKDVKKDRSGKVISTTERPEQVHMTKVNYDNFYRCNKCSHNWIVESENEYEG